MLDIQRWQKRAVVGDRLARRFSGIASRPRDFGIVVAVLALFSFLSIYSSVFLTKLNLLNILDQNAPVGIIACAQTLVIIGGGFDLSVGAMFALAGVAAAEVQPHVGTWPALGIGIVTGFGLGLVNAFLITVVRMNAFIATLASSFIFYGIGQVITQGFLVTVTTPSFSTLGNGEFAGVKYSIWLFLAVAVLSGVALRRMALGRQIFAVGGNAEAARLSGIAVDLVRVATFALSGAAAGVAGVLAVSRISQAQADVGGDLALTSIAAVIIGGTSILGGEGAIWRTILGVLLLAMIGNGFNILNVNPVYQQIVEGGVIVLAVAIDMFSRRREA
jgi:ribose transport system permease protein